MQRLTENEKQIGVARQHMASQEVQLPFARMRGEFRLRLYNEVEFQRLKQKHPDWPREYLLALCLDDDSGWTPNVITDYGRQKLHGQGFEANMDVFIHASKAPGNLERNCLQFIYGNQTPSQVANPVNVFDSDTLVQTRTQTFTAPAVTRLINTVGLTTATTATTTEGYLFGICAYSMLSVERTQTTIQTADVQYRVTWSFT